MTISISFAPASIAIFASIAFDVVKHAPSGKPITEIGEVELEESNSEQRGIQLELTHTVLKLYCSASWHSFRTSASVASGLRRVWSINPDKSIDGRDSLTLSGWTSLNLRLAS